MEIKRFREFSENESMADDFINSFDKLIVESDSINYKKIQDKLLNDLKLNINLVGTFGAGIGALYPIVSSLMRNMNINSLNITTESIVLMTISAFTIAYLEEKKVKDPKEEEELVKSSKSMLEELKMMGIGNGLVKKLIKAFKSIFNIFNLIFKHTGSVVGGFIDMFSYASFLIPIMNGIGYIIGKYDLNLDTIIQNFTGLSMGVMTIIAKHGIVEILNKIKGKFPINKKGIISEIETPVIQKFSTFDTKTDTSPDLDLIKEQ